MLPYHHQKYSSDHLPYPPWAGNKALSHTYSSQSGRRSKGKGKLIRARDRGLFLLRAPKFPLLLPLLTQATPILVSCFVVCILQFYGNRKSKLGKKRIKIHLLSWLFCRVMFSFGVNLSTLLLKLSLCDKALSKTVVLLHSRFATSRFLNPKF